MQWRKIFNFWRVQLLYFIFPCHVRRMLKLRKGSCKHCGVCCADCEHIIKKGDEFLCTVYHNRPRWCTLHKDFPIDEFDRNSYNKNCGYYWNSKA